MTVRGPDAEPRLAFVFTGEVDGTVSWYPDSVSRGFKRIRRIEGLDGGARLNDLRHCLATQLLSAGVDVRTACLAAQGAGIMRGVEVRRPDLSKYAGRYVALDLTTDAVLADAATILALVKIIRESGLRASIARAPRDDEPVLVGLG